MSVPPRRRRVRLAGAGLELALLDWGGSGPLVLLHHANGFCAGVWEPVARALGEGHRVIALDARGHGESDKPSGAEAYRWDCFASDLGEVAERLAAEHPDGRVALAVGHSFGGTATLGAAASHGAPFDALLLVDPVLPPPPDALPSPERTRRVRSLGATARRRRAEFASREEARASWARRRFFADWDPRALDAYAAWGLRELPDGRVALHCPPEVEATIFERSGGIDVLGLARKVRAPTRVLWARHGDFPLEAFRKLVAALPRGELVELDAGHLIPMERPELMAEAIRAR